MKRRWTAALATALALSACEAAPPSLSGSRSKDADDDATTSASADTDSTSDGSNKKAEPPKKLAFEFDGTVLRARLREAGTVSARVFAAKIGEDLSEVDCSSLTRVGGADGDLVVVPTDSKLIESRLDGTLRTIIHGCLTDASGKVIERVSTTLMNAWDADPTSVAASPRLFRGIEAYSKACEDELGEIPVPGWKDGRDFDCRDSSMQVIPITATDANGKVVSITKDTPWPLGEAERAATQRCDRPAWLDYGGGDNTPCAPFTRIGTYTNSQGSRFVMICRRTIVAKVDDPTFQVMGMIANNPKSGKTCFFNAHDGTNKITDGTKIPPPNTSNADRWWMNSDEMKGQNCVSCHDSDAFLHSPWIDQPVDANGRVLVPKMGNDPAYTATMKYSVALPDSLGWAQPRFLENVGACGDCHRIGAGFTTQQLWARSVGDETDSAFRSFLTPAFRTFEKLHWMPTTPVTEATWTGSPNGRSVDVIFGCMNDPSSCATKEVPR